MRRVSLLQDEIWLGHGVLLSLVCVRSHSAASFLADARVPAQVCTVFAQLTVRDKWEGPHVFVVRLRDDQGRTMPGVRILDNGAKVRPPSACCSSGVAHTCLRKSQTPASFLKTRL